MLKGNTIDHKIWSLEKEESDPKNIRFFYPSVFNEESYYIKKSVLLEVGVKGRVSPFEIRNIVSYVEKSFENILQKPTPSNIRTLLPIRTFWEKITLMHAENHRPIAKLSGDRLSRHYYDVHQLIENGYADQALSAIDLLMDVIENKKTNFRSAWANYDGAIPGTLLIYPNDNLLDNLRNDYKQMRSMIFGEAPDFDQILDSIKSFEEKVNAVGWKNPKTVSFKIGGGTSKCVKIAKMTIKKSGDALFMGLTED